MTDCFVTPHPLPTKQKKVLLVFHPENVSVGKKALLSDPWVPSPSLVITNWLVWYVPRVSETMKRSNENGIEWKLSYNHSKWALAKDDSDRFGGIFGEIGDQNSPLLNEGRRICKKSNPAKVYLQNSNLVETTRYLQNCYAKVIFFATHS